MNLQISKHKHAEKLKYISVDKYWSDGKINWEIENYAKNIQQENQQEYRRNTVRHSFRSRRGFRKLLFKIAKHSNLRKLAIERLKVGQKHQ